MNTKINQRRARALTFMLSLGMLAGVLIWAKLRLVTDIPRSALADPKQVDTAKDKSGESIDQSSDGTDDFEVPSDGMSELPKSIDD